jgi:hypothetical protein
MKKLLLPVVLLSALALSGATVPAVAESPATVTVEAVQTVTADSGAVLTPATVEVSTTAATVQTVTTTPDPTTPAVPATVEPTTAPVTPAPTATTVPATTAPAESYVPPAPVEGPAPVSTPVADAIQEDDPRWNCETMGNKVCGPASGESVDNWLSRTCFGPILVRDEYAGIMRSCKYTEAQTILSGLTANYKWIGTGPQVDECTKNGMGVAVFSTKYPNTVHNFRDESVPPVGACAYIPVSPTVQ